MSLMGNRLITVLNHVVFKDFISRSLCMGLVLYPAKNKEIHGVVPYQKFFVSCYITFKKKTLTCGLQVGHMWVKSGLFCG